MQVNEIQPKGYNQVENRSVRSLFKQLNDVPEDQVSVGEKSGDPGLIPNRSEFKSEGSEKAPTGLDLKNPPESSKPAFLIRAGAAGLTALALVGALAGCSPGSAPQEVPQQETQIEQEVEAPGQTEQTQQTQQESQVSQNWMSGVFQHRYMEPEETLRIDVVRQTDSETITDMDGESHTETIDADLFPAGVDLGDGLFYDLNGNITFNPLRVGGEDFKKIEINPTGMANDTRIDRDGSRITIDHPGWGGKTKVDLGQNQVRVDVPVLSRDVRVTNDGNKTVVNHPVFSMKTEITQDGGHTNLKLPGWGNDMSIDQDDDGAKIKLPGVLNDVSITEKGNQTVIDPPGPGNSVTITRDGNKTTINPYGMMNNTTITRNGNTITVDPYGAMNSTVIKIQR